MSTSPYLDYLYNISSFVEDDGYDTSSSLTSHYTFNRSKVRESDISVPPHLCAYKNIHIKNTEHFNENRVGVPNCNDFETTELQYCEKCGWWRVEHLSYHYLSSNAYATKRETYGGVQKVFSDPLEIAAVREVDKLLRSGNRQPGSLSPRLLETTLASVFSTYYGAKVKHVGGPGDGGVDLFCVIGDETFLIQVKRRSNGKAEAVSVVRDLIGAYALATGGIKTSRHSAHIITSAPHFSKKAVDSSKSESLKKYSLSIDLHAYDELKEIFGFACGRISEPWKYLALEGKLIKGRLII